MLLLRRESLLFLLQVLESSLSEQKPDMRESIHASFLKKSSVLINLPPKILLNNIFSKKSSFRLPFFVRSNSYSILALQAGNRIVNEIRKNIYFIRVINNSKIVFIKTIWNLFKNTLGNIYVASFKFIT